MTALPANSGVRLEDLTAALAFDLAAQLSPMSVILERYQLTPEQLKAALTHPPFVKLVKEAQAKWNSDMSVAERVRLKAQFALESCILPVHGIAHNKDTGAASRIDAVKLLSTIAGMSRGDAVAQEGSKFSLTINLGEKSTSLQVAPPTIEQ